ncbi:uncharacterized protein LOC105441846 isoform X2 [Strongylocentrotus purpuratus]|uniref:Uncharacterized protein n=1 Tax=Strongylocentrotus purpuratus TaxID=7668 RepID=A0A7M7P593_STRPU|nr:uncharacterized protein LOC105441846 isoform X2 [Strongylocentrotus purpuratus]
MAFLDNSTRIGHYAPSSTTWTAPQPQNYAPQNYQLQSYPLQSYYYSQQGYSNNLYPPICPPGQILPQYVDNRNGMAVPYTTPPIFMPGTAPPPSFPPPVFWPPQGCPSRVTTIIILQPPPSRREQPHRQPHRRMTHHTPHDQSITDRNHDLPRPRSGAMQCVAKTVQYVFILELRPL